MVGEWNESDSTSDYWGVYLPQLGYVGILIALEDLERKEQVMNIERIKLFSNASITSFLLFSNLLLHQCQCGLIDFAIYLIKRRVRYL